MNVHLCMLACAAIGCATPMQTAAPADAEVIREVIEARSTEDPMELATELLTFARVDPVRWTYGETGLTLEVRHEPGPVADVSCFGHIHELGRDAKCSIRVTGPTEGAARLGTTNAAMILNEDADADEHAVLIVGVGGTATKWTARPAATAAPTIVGYDLYREGQWLAAVDLRGELHLAASAPRTSRVLAGTMAAVLLWLPGPSGEPRVKRGW